MNNLNLKKVAENLIDTFIEAGNIAKKISSEGPKITIKADNTPVTNGDLAVDKLLRNKIIDLTPGIPIISEETVQLEKKNVSKNFWLIDPIDGTKEYIKNKDEYTINAALIIDLNPVMGLVYAPSKDRLFFSYGKNNAFEINEAKKKPINCKKVNVNEIIGLANSDKTSDQIISIYKKNKVTKITKMSSSLKFCTLAAGEADIYAAMPRAFEWDIAAGHVILEHAGGTVRSHEGNKLLYGKDSFRNPALIAKRAEKLDI